MKFKVTKGELLQYVMPIEAWAKQSEEITLEGEPADEIDCLIKKKGEDCPICPQEKPQKTKEIDIAEINKSQLKGAQLVGFFAIMISRKLNELTRAINKLNKV